MKCKIDAAGLKKIIKGAKKFTSPYSFNKMLQYIRIDVNAETMELTASAVDGHRFSIDKIKVYECDKSFSCLIKPILPKMERNLLYAEISLENNKAYLTAGDYVVGFVQPEGEWMFDLKKMLKDSPEPKATICVDAKLMYEALQSVNCLGESHNYVKIDVRHDTELITIRNKGGDIKAVLPVHNNEEW